MMWLSPTFATANEKNAKKTAYFAYEGERGKSSENVVLHAVTSPMAVLRQAQVIVMPSRMPPDAPK